MASKKNTGLRGQVAKTLSGRKGRKKNIVQRTAADLTGAASDVRKRLMHGDAKRGLTGRKSAATRKQNAAKRSAAAKRGHATRRAKAAR
jgi:hypothetical protein